MAAVLIGPNASWNYVWLISIFAVGAAVGSFLNVALVRLPLGKSVLWPGSHCGHCRTKIPWCHNIPLLSYWLLRGRCHACGVAFSLRYFLVELAVALGFVSLFYLDVMENIHGWPDADAGWGLKYGYYPWAWWLGFFYHAGMLSFLSTAAFCCWKARTVPWRLLLGGTVLGLAGGLLCLPS